MPPRIPKYRRRPDRNVAFAEHPRGKRIYFRGSYDSPESRKAYAAWLRSFLVEPESGITPPPRPGIVSIEDLAVAFLDWARLYYFQNGKLGSEYHCLRSAVVPLLKTAASVMVDDFGPRLLKQVRLEMCRRNWTRNTVNDHIGRIRRVFRWGVEHEFVPATIYQSLQAVAPLRKGRTELSEGNGVGPVDPAHVNAILGRVGPVVSAMIQLQQAAGMRPQDVCQIRPENIDQTADVWVYRPPQHKGTWRDQSRAIAIGPRGQTILLPWMNRKPSAFCFSPIESEAARRPPKKPAAKRRTSFRTHYDSASYRRAIRRAIDAVNLDATKKARDAGEREPALIPYWSPNQLRHNAGKLVRDKYGLEAAQVYLGHTRADVTEIYAERDLGLAKRVAREIG